MKAYEIPCPVCGAPEGKRCRTPKGAARSSVHKKRSYWARGMVQLVKGRLPIYLTER